MEKMQTNTPKISATCCFHGVEPTRYPVFRSWLVSPAFDAAMQTTPPTVIASAPKAGAVQPLTRKTAAVAISVAIVMPDTGDADEPTMPTMRAETVTNKNPKTTIRIDAARFAPQPTCAPGTGLNTRNRNISTASTALPPKTTLGGRSCSMREGFAAPSLAAPFFKPCVSALTMVGSVRISVISPDAATAPAPIGRTYADHRSEGDMSRISAVAG